MRQWHHLQTQTQKRESAEARGRWAEEQAKHFLEGIGYIPLAMRAKTPLGEIDLIVRAGTLLVFVEVKYRDSLEEGLWSITPNQQGRIARAAEFWMASKPEFTTFDMRFDAIIANAQGVASHLVDAFRPEF